MKWLRVALMLLLGACAWAQTPLDPTRGLPYPPPAEPHAALPEEYVWTAGDVTVKRADRSKFSWARQELRVDPHYFRARFPVGAVPAHATVYIAGPRAARVFVNGRLAGEFRANPDAPINFHVFHADVAALLHPGENVVAVEAVRGRGVVTGAGPIATQQMGYGEVLAVKLVPLRFGGEGPALVVSDGGWKSSATLAAGWEQAGFDDGLWGQVDSLGPVEGNIDLLQWNVDAGMYGWPGYRGMSGPLRTYPLRAAAVTHVFAGAGEFAGVETLTGGGGEFRVTLKDPAPTDAEAPALLLDFGREVAGRLLVESGAGEDARISVAYGESELEAMATGLTPLDRGGNYLGTNVLDVPAGGVARGPKSAFRYARVRFLRGGLVFKALRLEGIYYPVAQVGSFESSDPVLNRVWETGAYTVHLCMQDGLWDGAKRDRGRWVGDIDVEGRVLLTAFGDATLLEDTLRRLAEATGPGQYVNGIAGYTALWITSLDTLYQHTGDRDFVRSQKPALLRFVARMREDLGPDGMLKAGKGWGFVDWAPGLYGQTEATREGTQLHYLRGFQAADRLLRAMPGVDLADAKMPAGPDGLARLTYNGARVSDAASSRPWQLDALAVLATADTDDGFDWTPPARRDMLRHLQADPAADEPISPYFGSYVLNALARVGARAEALAWMKAYWGGMLAEGATSFWESYDLRWPKGPNFALSLQADGTSGYFVSLAHGWSAGPTAWLTENVLGVLPSSPGYDDVSIAPKLLGLAYANGAVPTPHGLIVVNATPGRVEVDLPVGVRGTEVYAEVADAAHGAAYLDGKRVACEPGAKSCGGSVSSPGHHVLELR